MKTAVVIPSNRELAEEQLDLLSGADVFVVEDSGFRRPPPRPRLRVLTLEEQRDTMGEDFDLLGNGSAAVRNFGSLHCWREGYDVVIHMDDDCWPEPGFVAEHEDVLSRPVQATEWTSNSGWITPGFDLGQGLLYTRGFPYEARIGHAQESAGLRQVRSVVHMGLWNGVLDLNAVDRNASPEFAYYMPECEHHATRCFFPLSAMNFSVSRAYLPVTYQVPWASWGPTLKLQRFDDIIGGVVTQTVARLRGDWVTFGAPWVDHRQRPVDGLRVAAQENLGNVMIGRLAQWVEAEMCSAPCGAGAEPSGPLEDARCLLGDHPEMARYEHWVDIPNQIAEHCTSTYRRWLELFE